MKDLDAKNKALRILGLHDPFQEDNLKDNHFYTYPGYERDDELILLLENLGLIKADWETMEKQTHREVGNRTIDFVYEGKTIKDFLDKINGKNSIIKKQTLEFVANKVCSLKKGEPFYTFLRDCDVPTALLISSSKNKANEYYILYNVLITLASVKNKDDRKKLFKIIEDSSHPLFFQGDSKKAGEYTMELNNMLSFDDLAIQEYKIIRIKKKNRAGTISKITFVAKADKPICYFVNDDVANIKNIRKNSERMRILFRIIKDEEDVAFNKSIEDYFNYNRKCPLYFKGKYALTNIINRNRNFNENDYFRLNMNIRGSIISETAFKRLQGSKLKS
ncbi:MAG: hypothetical protein PHO29_12580 [Acetobacterium sp.]|nr:hypothetical protein [Acetobacterium sp.]